MKWDCFCLLAALACITSLASADDAALQGALARMPVREVTVFKDGHAFVLHEGAMPVDASGDVQMDYLPTPVLGTFWPYSADQAVRLTAVTASPRRVLVARTALTVKELIEANPGAEISLYDTQEKKRYTAQIVGVPTRTSTELTSTSPPDTDERLPEKSNLVLLKRADGVQVIGLDRIQELTFVGPYKKMVDSEEFRNLLSLKLDWQGARAARTAHVGMVYVQKGIRWIPEYKISLDGKGTATVKLQATILNELTDLNDVTTNLVIGVPTFFFKDTADPISLQQTLAQLSPYFQSNSQTGFALSNGLMGQVARQGERPGAAVAAGGNLGPEIGGGDRTEDLFIFTVKHVTLKKGQRMVIPVAEVSMKYSDVYSLNIAFAPPKEIRTQIRDEQQAELALLANRPRVMHNIRLLNASRLPLTTAPALVLKGDSVLAQALMTYTPVGGAVDLPLTTAVEVSVKKSEHETGRTQKAVRLDGSDYERIDVAGTITVTNHRPERTEVEVTRNVVGSVGTADNGGVAEMVNALEDDGIGSDETPSALWNGFSWPGWWGQLNGIGKIKWKIKLDPGKSVNLGYTWHYFWR